MDAWFYVLKANRFQPCYSQSIVQNKHTWVLKLTPVHSRQVVSCQVEPRTCHWDCVFWHNFSGMKWTWITGSWQCCLSPEVMSLIPPGSTIIYWFLCVFICVSLCQSIKIKPWNIYTTPLLSSYAHIWGIKMIPCKYANLVITDLSTSWLSHHVHL